MPQYAVALPVQVSATELKRGSYAWGTGCLKSGLSGTIVLSHYYMCLSNRSYSW